MINARWMLTIGGTLALGICYLMSGQSSRAAADKDLTGTVLKVADAIEKKDTAAAKKEAQAIKDAEIEDIMHLMSLRSKKGLGIGAKAGAVTPDGIEAKVIALAQKAPTQKDLDEHAADLARAAYISAAVGEVIVDKCPVKKKEGEKDPKDWKNWSEALAKSSVDLAEAAKSKKPAAVKAAADKVDAACKNCHKVFRD